LGLGRWVKVPAYTSKAEKYILLLGGSITEYAAMLAMVIIFLYAVLVPSDPYNRLYCILLFAVPLAITLFTLILFHFLPNRSPHDLMIYRYLALLLQLVDIKSSWPHYVFLSDGGHIENYGMLALLRRKCKRIFLCDGTQDVKGTCDDLFKSLRLAEQRLYCSFLALDSDDSAVKYIENNFVANPNRGRFISFRVKYNDGTFGSITLLRSKYSKDNTYSGMCCNCCLKQKCWDVCCATFPQTSTGNQFFSTGMYSAYQEEGNSAFEEFKTEHPDLFKDTVFISTLKMEVLTAS